MKLSEAILLGSTVVSPKAGSIRFSRENAGCALGMAAIATGCTFVKPLRQIPAKDLRTVNVENIWGLWLLRPVVRPCDCRTPITLRGLRLGQIIAYLSDRSAPLPRDMRIKDIIAHLFDHHVMVKKNWTLDQLAAWVERWEPNSYPQGMPEADTNRIPRVQPQSVDPDDGAEWLRTRQAFEKRKANVPEPTGYRKRPRATSWEQKPKSS
ncbi:MAG: hypothetical protein WCB53_16230 [Terriglobales bacterium]